MTLFSRHLDAATLGLAVLGDTPDPRVDAHLGSCARCRRERDRIAGLLTEAWDEADAQVDAAFGPAELDQQRHAIMQRIVRTGGVARVLRFPHGHDERGLPAPRVDTRWLAAAAAAGLLIGIAAGQLPHLYTSRQPAQVATGVVRAAVPVLPPAAPDWRSDDTLLSEVDAALANDTRPELEALDALTPVHYETR